MKFKSIVLFIIAALVIGLSCFSVDKYNRYKEQKALIQSFSLENEYKEELLERYLSIYNSEAKYTKDEIIILVNNDIDLIGNLNVDLVFKFIEDPYYIKKNLKRYYDYYLYGKYVGIRNTVAIVNANADQPIYENVQPADLSKEYLILCNRYYYLPEDYVYGDLVEVDKEDTTAKSASLNVDVYKAYLELKKDAIAEGNTICINGDNGYRSYERQKESFDWYEKTYDYQTALAYAAKPGYSEHQTGLAVDVMFNYKGASSYSYKDFDWIKENSWKYGFILRYPEGKELITNNDYEPWHYRYVGKEVAKYIKEHDITFDEYYNYFLMDNNITSEEFVKIFE